MSRLVTQNAHIHIYTHIYRYTDIPPSIYIYICTFICNYVTDSEKPLRRKGSGCYALVTECYRME